MQQREPRAERITGAWSGPSGRVSVLVPTSAVPTNPSAEHLEAALASVARHPLLAAAPKLVIFDALPAAAHLERYRDPKWRTFWTDPGGYAEYREAVIARCARGAAPFQNTRGLVMPRFSHVTGGLRAALHHVTTRHVLVVQHDLELIRAGSCPWRASWTRSTAARTSGWCS